MSTEKLAEKVESIRHQLVNVTNDIPMTRAQLQTMDIVSTRLWELFVELRKMATKEKE